MHRKAKISKLLLHLCSRSSEKMFFSLPSPFVKNFEWVKEFPRQARQMNESLSLVNKDVSKKNRSFYFWGIFLFQVVYPCWIERCGPLELESEALDRDRTIVLIKRALCSGYLRDKTAVVSIILPIRLPCACSLCCLSNAFESKKGRNS